MRNDRVCPQCGAAITSETCPYCGAVFFDFAAIDMDQPFYIKIKRGNMIYRMKARLNMVNFEERPIITTYYADNAAVFNHRCGSYRKIKMEMDVLPDEKILGYIVDTEIAKEVPWND
ncbi:MAG: hypothetical protein IKY16_02580 [Bacteroidales bacterium]|nr:hypothetical protein [Bacteroidales bacterium]